MSGITEGDLESFIHPASMRIYQRASKADQVKILEWVPVLQQMSDERFVVECASKILDSAIMNGWRGNASGIHARADICHDEAKRRHQLAGHDADCREADLYVKGHNEAMRSQGHSFRPPNPCTCGKGE